MACSAPAATRLITSPPPPKIFLGKLPQSVWLTRQAILWHTWQVETQLNYNDKNGRTNSSLSSKHPVPHLTVCQEPDGNSDKSRVHSQVVSCFPLFRKAVRISVFITVVTLKQFLKILYVHECFACLKSASGQTEKDTVSTFCKSQVMFTYCL